MIIHTFQCLEIPIVYEVYESGDCSPEYEFPPRPTLQVAHSPHHTSSASGEACDKKASDKKGHSQSQNHRKKKGVGICSRSRKTRCCVSVRDDCTLGYWECSSPSSDRKVVSARLTL